MTMYERIKVMTIEEMADFISALATVFLLTDCTKHIIEQNTDGLTDYVKEILSQEIEEC